MSGGKNQIVSFAKKEAHKEEILPGIPDHIKLKLADLVTHLNKCEAVIESIGSKSNNDLQSMMSELDIAKLNWISIYAINSLFFVYLKNTGVTLKDHPLMTELGRIRSYMTRIKEIEEAEKIKNTQRIDKECSARIIKRSLWLNASKKNGNLNTKNTENGDGDDEGTKSTKRINLNN